MNSGITQMISLSLVYSSNPEILIIFGYQTQYAKLVHMHIE